MHPQEELALTTDRSRGLRQESHGASPSPATSLASHGQGFVPDGTLNVLIECRGEKLSAVEQVTAGYLDRVWFHTEGNVADGKDDYLHFPPQFRLWWRYFINLYQPCCVLTDKEGIVNCVDGDVLCSWGRM